MRPLTLLLLTGLSLAPLSASAQVTAIRAGRLIDPETGSLAENQVILVEGTKITAVGRDVTLPPGAEVVDLSNLTVLPGLVDAHDHLALTINPERDPHYYITVVYDSTPMRAIQAVSNAYSKLAYGFTIVRDLGNNGLYADTALRCAIEEGWVPGPTIVNSGIIIGAFGGQFHEVPERQMLVYPEYLDADTEDEIIKAVRQNLHYGAKVIKVCVDCQKYPYTLDQLKVFVREGENAGVKVAGHVQTEEGARRAILAGFWSLEHGRALTDELLRMMKERGVWRVGTDTPLNEYSNDPERYAVTVDRLKTAYRIGVKLAFSTDADYWIRGTSRGELTIDFIRTWKDAGIPAPAILKAMTVNGAKVSDLAHERGNIKPGLAADIIAVPGNPLQEIDGLRQVEFVMKDGRVFKRDGVVQAEKFFNSGPRYGLCRR